MYLSNIHSLLPKAKKNISFYYKIIVFILASLYGCIFASFPMEGIIDRDNYLMYAENSILIVGRYITQNILTFFVNEPLWLGINILLSLFFDPEVTVRIIASVPAFVVAYYVLRYNPKYFIFLLFLLFLPQVMKNHAVHLRQGVAIAFFIAGWFSSKRYLQIFLIFLTPFIHASFFFILFLLGLNRVFTKMKFALDLKTFLYIILCLIIGLSIGLITSSLGARQVNYNTSAEISGLGFIFWTAIISLYFLEGKQFAKQHSFSIAILIFYLSTYFVFEATGRVLESALILLILSGLDLTKWRKQVFYLAVILYFIMMYSSRIMLPYLGWIN